MNYKPKLIEISSKNLIKHIRVKASSGGSGYGPQCRLSYIDEQICGIWADGNDGGGGWGNMCVDIGPLFGCTEHGDWYCSTVITPIAK